MRETIKRSCFALLSFLGSPWTEWPTWTETRNVLLFSEFWWHFLYWVMLTLMLSCSRWEKRRRICSVKLLRKQIKCLLIENSNTCLHVTTIYHIHSLPTDANWQAKLTHVSFMSPLWGLIGILGYFILLYVLLTGWYCHKWKG